MLNFQEAKDFLNRCVRSECRDHAFGDAEIFFELDGVEVAGGYVGGDPRYSIWAEEDSGYEFEEFAQEETKALLKCGSLGDVERNDSTGPDNFQEGVTMPGLTREGVRKELTERHNNN
jgi:hypothetical protein